MVDNTQENKDKIQHIGLGEYFNPFAGGLVPPREGLDYVLITREFEIIGVGRGRFIVEDLTSPKGGHWFSDSGGNSKKVETCIITRKSGELDVQEQTGIQPIFELSAVVTLPSEVFDGNIDWKLQAKLKFGDKVVGTLAMPDDDYADIVLNDFTKVNGTSGKNRSLIIPDENFQLFTEKARIAFEKTQREEIL